MDECKLSSFPSPDPSSSPSSSSSPSPLYKLSTSRHSGRTVLSTSPLPRGTLVADTAPLSYIVFPSHCHTCLRRLPTTFSSSPPTPCPSHCGKLLFCSPQCCSEYPFLSSHLLICHHFPALSLLSSRFHIDFSLIRLALETISSTYENDGNLKLLKDFSSLLSHSDKVDKEFKNSSIKVGEEILNLLSSTPFPLSSSSSSSSSSPSSPSPTPLHLPPPLYLSTPLKIFEFFCRINTNSYGLLDSDGENSTVGVTLVPFTSLLNHSCSPNCNFIPSCKIPGGISTITIRDISHSNEELCFSYIDIYQSRCDRHRELFHTKHFSCKCDRCKIPIQQCDLDIKLEGVKCDGCHYGGVIIFNSHFKEYDNPTLSSRLLFQCSAAPQCKKKYCKDDVDKILSPILKFISDIQQMKKDKKYSTILPLITAYLPTITPSILPPSHPLLLHLHTLTLNTILRLPSPYDSGIVEVSESIVDMMRMVYGGDGCVGSNEMSDFALIGAEECEKKMEMEMEERRRRGNNKDEKGKEIEEVRVKGEKMSAICYEIRRVCCGENHRRTMDAKKMMEKFKFSANQNPPMAKKDEERERKVEGGNAQSIDIAEEKE